MNHSDDLSTNWERLRPSFTFSRSPFFLGRLFRRFLRCRNSSFGWYSVSRFSVSFWFLRLGLFSGERFPIRRFDFGCSSFGMSTPTIWLWVFLIPGFSTYRTNYVCGRQANISLPRNCSPYLVNFHLFPLASILVAILFRASWMLFGSSLRMSTLHINRHTRNAPGSSMVPRRGLTVPFTF